MITLFDIFQWLMSLIGAVTGAILGHGVVGWPGAVGGAVLGAVLGYWLGAAPFLIGLKLLQRHLNDSTVDELRADLSRNWVGAHLVIAELVARGERVEQHLPLILSLLRSPWSDQRVHGWANLSLWFPELAAQLPDFDPNAPTEVFWHQLSRLQNREL